LLQFEENQRQHIRNSFCELEIEGEESQIKVGNLISVGIDKIECQRFVVNQREKFIELMRNIDTWQTNLKLLDETQQKYQKEMKIIDQNINTSQKSLNAIKHALNNANNSEDNMKLLSVKKTNEENQIVVLNQNKEKLQKNLDKLQTQKLNYISQIILMYKDEFNLHYLNEISEISNQEKENRVKNLISYFAEVKKLNLRWDIKKTLEQKEVDTYRLTLLTFAIISLSKIKHILDEVLNTIQDQVNKMTVKKQKMKNEHQKYEDNLDELVKNINSFFINHGLIKYKPLPRENLPQIFMSPFYSILLKNWLHSLERDVGLKIEFTCRERVDLVDRSSTDKKDHRSLIDKIELEWHEMQRFYNESGSSSTYKWSCDLSKKQLELKPIETLYKILQWKIFVFNAHMCCMQNISKLTKFIYDEILQKYGDNKQKYLTKLIMNQESLLDNIKLKQDQHKFEYPVDSNGDDSDNIQQSSLYVSGIDDFEQRTLEGLIVTDSALYFSSESFKDLSMKEIQAKMFQSAKLLLPRPKYEQIDNDQFKTRKWFEKIENHKLQQKPSQEELQQEVLEEISHQGVSVEESQPTTLPYLITLPTGPLTELKLKNHVKVFRNNRSFITEQSNFTYTDDLFQTHFLTINVDTLCNRLIGIVSYFTDFSVQELTSKINDIIDNKHKYSSLNKLIYEEDLKIEDIKRYIGYEKYDTDQEQFYEEITFVSLVHIVKRPICTYSGFQNREEISMNTFYTKDFTEQSVFAEPIYILCLHVNETIYFEYLVVDGYSPIKSVKTYKLEETLYDTVEKWNQPFQDLQDYKKNLTMSSCKHYLFLIYNKSKYTINKEILAKLHKTLTGKNLRKFLSMEKDLNLVCGTYPMTTEEIEALSLQSKYDLLEDCIHLFSQIQKIKSQKRTTVPKNPKKNKEEDLVEQVNEAYEIQNNSQSGCRPVKSLDGGYDTGETKNYGVQDGTDDENDWDDGYDDGDDDSENNDDENEQDKNDRKEAKRLIQGVEKLQRNQAQGNRPSTVTFRNAKGQIKQRRENANEKGRRLNNEGKVSGLREAANKRVAEAQARRAAEAWSSGDDDEF